MAGSRVKPPVIRAPGPASQRSQPAANGAPFTPFARESSVDHAIARSLPSRVRQRLRESFDTRRVVDVLDQATGGELYVFGGTLRRVLFGDERLGDLDLMVPNGDVRAFDALDTLQVPFELTRQRHRRYRCNGLQVDMFEPQEFYKGFQDVEGALRFFDLKINALALHLRSGRVVDPFQMLSEASIVDPGINWPRWSEMAQLELTVLAIRLARIMQQTPKLTLSTADADRLRTDVLPRIRECEWSSVRHRFPLGKDAFLQRFETKVLGRVRRRTHSHTS